ncbi:MAG TPA: hypothetical protein DEG71_00160, partial [Clostridiales bacterium]|nr:hypothetical protein [Clostridiales bacterium]
MFIHPELKTTAKVTYNSEYTEKDEDFKDDFSNVKKIDCKDLEEMTKYMFQLRQRNMYNINLYTLVENNGQWIMEDNAMQCECFKDTLQAEKTHKYNRELTEAMEEKQKELDLYKSFIAQYNATKEFEKWKKEQNTFTYYYRLRPPSPGCQPKNGLLEMNSEKVIHNDRTYWGSCTYDRE